ncbi:MAG: hypothetical protein Q8N23_00175 [Archangium sp.]|nr:hypothetical protein [Archangium sp.]MDP3151048.1 hypothetical protein [Archangium sp.]MDP3571732.1 hypothetical protein [Archangium sp.]
MAAFTLAISTALGDDLAGAQKMVPTSSLPLLNGVSHALGDLLGDALAQAYARKAISSADPALFAQFRCTSVRPR